MVLDFIEVYILSVVGIFALKVDFKGNFQFRLAADYYLTDCYLAMYAALNKPATLCFAFVRVKLGHVCCHRCLSGISSANHCRLSGSGEFRQRFSSTVHTSERPKLVILGSGWGSYSVLKNIDKKYFDVIVVSPRNHFLFTPLLCSTTVGTLEFRSIIEPVRNAGFRNPEHFHQAEAVGLNIEKQIITCRSDLENHKVYDVSYDKLVIGVGAVSNTFNVPGVKEHAFFLKEISDARAIRNRILSNFELSLQPGTSLSEKKRLLHIVIVGGGPTGVEFGAELYDFVKQDVSRLYPEEQLLVRVSLIEGRKILSAFNQKLQQYAEKKIKARGQMELIQSNVTDVKCDSVTLQDGSVLPCGLVVWSTGLAPRPFVQSLDFPKTVAGQILTDNNLQVKGDPSGNVYALGDCADIEGEGLPCTAQVAERQGRYLANCLSTGDHSKSFHYKSMGMLAYVGDYKAVSDTPALKTQGFNSWVLWRSAYLTRLGSWRLRMQVPIDWTKTMLFGRDISRF